MEIIESKRSTFSIMALILGITCILVFIMEFVHIFLEEPLIFFFSTPGDPVFETGILDHVMKGFVALVIGALFVYAYPKLKQGTLEGFSFLIGAGMIAIGIGSLYIIVWLAGLISTSLTGIIEPEVWEEFFILDGIRIECFIGIASLYILMIWKNREKYLV